jgi:hypothetical protein
LRGPVPARAVHSNPTRRHVVMESSRIPFAFRLADVREDAQADAPQTPWQLRDGVAIAGCTDPKRVGDYRWSGLQGTDAGFWC